MKNTYNTETKEVTTVSSVDEFRCIGIGLGLAMGGPGMAQHMLQGIVNAADNTSNDEDYQGQVEAFCDHVREEHLENEAQKQILEILRSMALALPRNVVMAAHFRHTGTSEQESHQA